MDKDYCVVTDVLTKHINILWDMSKNKEDWGIMDHIRMDQIHELKQCIRMWNEKKLLDKDSQ